MEAFFPYLGWLAELSSSAGRAGAVVGAIIVILAVVAVPVMFILSLVRYLSTRRGGWLAGLLISSLLLVAGVALFAAGAWKGIKEYGAQAKSTRAFTTSDGAVTVSTPANWKDLPQLPEEGTLRMGNLIREEYLVVLPESKADYPGTLEDSATAGAARIASAITGPTRSEPKLLTLDGRRAIQYEVSGTMDKHRIVYLQTTVETAGSFQHILMWTLTSKREVAMPIFEKVLNSARFDDKATIPAP